MAKIPLIVKVRDYNAIANNKSLLQKLRELTLHGYSGMNAELDYLAEQAPTRKVKTKVLLAYHEQDLIGWAILSQESSGYWFCRVNSTFDSKYGVLFEVFVDEKYRRKGVASALVEKAKTKVGSRKLCFVPWDSQSYAFYGKFNHINHMEL